MNNFFKLILIFLLIITKINNVDAYYSTNDVISNEINTNKYNIKLDANDGTFMDMNLVVNNNTIELPVPFKDGYQFLFYTDDFGNTYSNKIDSLISINNKNLYANWSKNNYIVNYYINDELLFQKSVPYLERVENIDIQDKIDKYHKFEGWKNYVDLMPNHDLNLYADISQSHCSIITGHGPYQNAIALKTIFDQMGYNSTIQRAYNNVDFLVTTDNSLTLKEFEDLKDYLENNTNYTSFYPYPYLYWIELDCDNNYTKVYQRNVGELKFK